VIRRTVTSVLLAAQLLASCALTPAFAGSIAGANVPTLEISCPAAGTSATVLPAFIRRAQWTILNESGTDVRIGFVKAADGTPNLTTSNSVLLKTGKSLADSGDTVYIGRVVCMSTTASPVSVGVIRAER
jgi:hypothetical protein